MMLQKFYYAFNVTEFSSAMNGSWARVHIRKTRQEETEPGDGERESEREDEKM